jgi:hypothetical protein
VIGEVRQRWHLWRRKYDLFMDKRQFAAIDGGFLAWEFELKDASGNTLALIDRYCAFVVVATRPCMVAVATCCWHLLSRWLSAPMQSSQHNLSSWRILLLSN